jgi:hypothetical protein
MQIPVLYFLLHVTYLSQFRQIASMIYICQKIKIANCNLAKRIKYFRICDNEGGLRKTAGRWGDINILNFPPFLFVIKYKTFLCRVSFIFKRLLPGLSTALPIILLFYVSRPSVNRDACFHKSVTSSSSYLPTNYITNLVTK